jgi:hypothetical protein
VGVLALVVRVRVEELPVVHAGLKFAVTPLGSAVDILRQTFPTKPPVREMNTVKPALAPLVTATRLGLTIREKSPGEAAWGIVWT